MVSVRTMLSTYCKNAIAWDVERDLLEDTIRKNLSLRTMINKVLQSKENWTAFMKFCEIVILKKEEKEREEKVLRG